jgi:hypothetical protein
MSGTAFANVRRITSPLGQGHTDARLQGALSGGLLPVHQSWGMVVHQTVAGLHFLMNAQTCGTCPSLSRL